MRLLFELMVRVILRTQKQGTAPSLLRPWPLSVIHLPGLLKHKLYVNLKYNTSSSLNIVRLHVVQEEHVSKVKPRISVVVNDHESFVLTEGK